MAGRLKLFSLALTAGLILTFGGACAHQSLPVTDGVTPLERNEYNEIIRKATVKTTHYAGLYQTFQADMTILSSEVQTAILRQRAYFLQWDQKQFQSEREKMLQENSAYSKFFLRFFSPEHEYDDLHKGKTIWRVYLEMNNQRFEGKVKKMTEKFVELQTIFPHMDRFSTPYEITFNVPMATVERNDCKVILTSSLGNAQYAFPMQK
jgi:hypothetical protein